MLPFEWLRRDLVEVRCKPTDTVKNAFPDIRTHAVEVGDRLGAEFTR